MQIGKQPNWISSLHKFIVQPNIKLKVFFFKCLYIILSANRRSHLDDKLQKRFRSHTQVPKESTSSNKFSTWYPSR